MPRNGLSMSDSDDDSQEDLRSGCSPAQAEQPLEDRRERTMDMLAAGVVVASAFTVFMVSVPAVGSMKPPFAGLQGLKQCVGQQILMIRPIEVHVWHH